MKKKKRFPKILASILGVFAICGLVAGATIRDGDYVSVTYSIPVKGVENPSNYVDTFNYTYQNRNASCVTTGLSAQTDITKTTFDGSVTVTQKRAEEKIITEVSLTDFKFYTPIFSTDWFLQGSSGISQTGYDFVQILGNYQGTFSLAASITGIRLSAIQYPYICIFGYCSIDEIPEKVSGNPTLVNRFMKIGVAFRGAPYTDWQNAPTTGVYYSNTVLDKATIVSGFVSPMAYKNVKSTWSYEGFGKSQVGRFFPLATIDMSTWTDYTSAYDSGYQRGYSKGYSDGDKVNENMATIFSGIIDIGLLPINVFLDIFNFEVFGINFKPLVAGLLTALVAIIIFRMFMGKGGGGSE